jgi:hypothetical protein
MDEVAPVPPIVLELTAAEAFAVVNALRQYQPYCLLETTKAGFVEALAEIRGEIDSVLGKLRAAACD